VTTASDIPRIGIGGMSIESSTFSPHRSGEEAFTLRRGDDLIAYYPFLAAGQPLRTAAQWEGLVHARSLPGGAVPREFYDRVKAELLERAAEAAGRLDGFLLDIHGAMSVVGMDDAEGDLAAALREVIGPDVLVSATMDLHGNVSRRLAESVDLITCYRTAPHEDWMETKRRAAFNLLSRLGTASHPGAGKPLKAWVQVPVLLPGEKTSTRLDPAASLYAELPWIEVQPGVLDASIWVGYAWADEPDCRAAVVVTGDDAEAITAHAEHLARRYWEVRRDFTFVAPTDTLAGAVDKALAPGAARPFVISDSGDNPTAGGAGDVTYAATELLKDPRLTGEGAPTVLVASIFDADAVAAAWRAGIGASVVLEAGARVDAGPAGPVRLEGVVEALTEGDDVSGRVAVVRVGGLRFLITERRKPYHKISDFLAGGVDPREADIVIVKIGYLEPELYDLAADWILALTPGGVDQDLLRLGHHRLAGDVFPFVDDMPDPDLRAELV
jgi:microcystin degradation protein MlrC